MNLIERATAGVFAAVARLRGGEKAVHPFGDVYEAELAVDGTAPIARGSFLERPAEHRAIVRFSRSIGLPQGVPDLLGMSLRLLDVHGEGRHQDMLMVTSVDAPILHHLFVPVRSPRTRRLYSGSLPYRLGDEKVVLGARRIADGDAPRYEIGAAPLFGRLQPFGVLRVGDKLPEQANATRFNPWNCGGGLVPISPLNRLRDAAYKGSQDVWA